MGGASIRPDASLEIGDEWLSEEDRKAFDAYADWRMFRVWRDGHLILGSDTGPPLADTAPGPKRLPDRQGRAQDLADLQPAGPRGGRGYPGRRAHQHPVSPGAPRPA
ncbi:hypothetical protein ACRAWD_15875 [Caulobacter segnis]